MHSWSDDWPYWNDLYKAQNFIIDYVYKKSWCRVSMKEKWGTLRYGWIFPPRSGCGVRRWTCIRIPFLWTQYDKDTEKFKYVFDRTRWRVGYPVWRWCDSWLHNKWVNYGWKKLIEAAHIAAEKWPQCRKEILADLNWRIKND
jgi:hypothetical protein